MVSDINKAVFLDRDGVINRSFVRDGKPYPPQTLEELEILPGVVEGVSLLRQRGWLIVVVTNQPDVANGIQERGVVEAMHNYLRRSLAIDMIRVCFHADRDNCSCRKPKPGMLLEAAGDLEIDLQESIMVGDRWRDIEAGRAAGCKTVLVKSTYDERQADSPDLVVNSLIEAVNPILQQSF